MNKSIFNQSQSSYFQVSDELIHNTNLDLLHWIEIAAAQDLILDLELLQQVNHGLLISLVRIHQFAKSLGKTVWLSSVSAELRMVLELSRLDQVFNCVGA